MRNIAVNAATRIPDGFYCQMLVVVVGQSDDDLAEVLALMNPLRNKTTLVRWKCHEHTFYFGLLRGVCAAATHSHTPCEMLFIAFTELNPNIVASVGPAFGTDRSSQSLGDVLVPKTILVYDANQSSMEQGRLMDLDPDLQSVMNDAKHNFEIDFPNREQYLVHAGPLISRLIDLNNVANTKVKQELLCRFPDAIGGFSEVSV